jgi:hypothetical protein
MKSFPNYLRAGELNNCFGAVEAVHVAFCFWLQGFSLGLFSWKIQKKRAR